MQTHEILQQRDVVEKDGIHVSAAIANTTVWDTLAKENPTHAVISAKDEADAAEKSASQIADIKQHVFADTTLLDLGCGYGRVAKYLLPEQQLAGYIGVDSAYQMLQLFKQRYAMEEAERSTPLLLVNADIHSVPVQPKSVDVVVVCAVFLHNHKDTVQKSIREVTRILRPGGTLLVYSSFPNGASLMGLQGYLYQGILNLLGKPYTNGPVRYYRAGEVRHMLGDFASVDIKPVGFAVLPKTLIFLPGPLEKLYRLGIAGPVNRFLERILPQRWHRYFAVHWDAVVTR